MSRDMRNCSVPALLRAIGFERLSALFGDVFGVTVSEGALANLFKRVRPGFDEQAAVIKLQPTTGHGIRLRKRFTNDPLQPLALRHQP